MSAGVGAGAERVKAMRCESEKELEDLLFGNWWNLRRAGRIRSHALTSKHEVSGYRISRCAFRQVPIAGSSAAGGCGRADLVEVDIRRSEQHAVAFVTIVELKNEALTIAHLCQLLRYVVAAEQLIAPSSLPRSPNVSVKGLLIGPGVSEQLREFFGLASSLKYTGMLDIDIATIAVDPLSGVTVESLDPVRSMSDEEWEAAGRPRPRPQIEHDGGALVAHLFGEWSQASLGSTDAALTAPGGEA